MIENFEDVEKIKLIDCPMYNEFSVIILYKDGLTKIIELNSSKEAEELYYELNTQFEYYRQNNEVNLI